MDYAHCFAREGSMQLIQAVATFILTVGCAPGAVAAPAASPRAPIQAKTYTYEVLHSFGQSPGDGQYPFDELIRSDDGNFYGAAYGGGTGVTPGTSRCEDTGTDNCGMVFRWSQAGEFSVGNFPIFSPATLFPMDAVSSSLVAGPDGRLFGTLLSQFGGVYQVGKDGSLSPVFSFDGLSTWSPLGSLALSADGSIYGVTADGGAYTRGVAFKIDPQGKYSTIYQFGSKDTDPVAIETGLIMGPDGNLYGTSRAGGTLGEAGVGTVFRLTTAGKLTVIHTFDILTDGEIPGRLTIGPDGNIYGFTIETANGSAATLFRVTTSGRFKIIASNLPPGPMGRPTISADGVIYGAANSPSSCGSVFKIKRGRVTYMHSFECAPSADGRFPSGGLWLDSDGYLYGLTQRGGTADFGAIYRIHQ